MTIAALSTTICRGAVLRYAITSMPRLRCLLPEQIHEK